MWLARDKFGRLWLFVKEKPISRNGIYEVELGTKIEIDSTLFTELTCEDEPMEVDFVIKKNDEGKSCLNCKFKNDYPKCFKKDNDACEDWMKIKSTH